MFKRISSTGKVMATVFWDCDCVIMVDFLEKGNTVNKEYYSDELHWLRDGIE